MPKSGAKSEPSLWDQLPKADREAVQRELSAKRDELHAEKPPKKNGTFQLRGYARCELSASDKDAFREWEPLQEMDAIMARLIKAADSGYLIKVGEHGSGGQASLCASSTGHVWDGYVLVAHAGTAIRAATLLVYKHEVLMQGDWSAFLGDDGEDALR